MEKQDPYLHPGTTQEHIDDAFGDYDDYPSTYKKCTQCEEYSPDASFHLCIECEAELCRECLERCPICQEYVCSDCWDKDLRCKKCSGETFN